eukprot:Tbor_TRINITY_DN2753_c0_g1::TRINITY_DN2753_c0_g1_i1::g.15229::m.15229/K05605/HIBCH; 3-hydroxyisobutyryl-CoA hydrolase
MLRCTLLGRSSSVLTNFSTKSNTHFITLNREKALNSLNSDMIDLMLPFYKTVSAESSNINAVVIKGAGSKAFCAGGDVISMVKDIPKGTRKNFFYKEYQVNHSILSLPIPHVALWDGIVMGGGVGVSIHGSHRVVTEKATFAMPETAIGLFPDVGGSWFLPRLPIKGMGMFLALTGHRLKGVDLLHAGLATHYLPSEVMPLLESILSGNECQTMLSEAPDKSATKDSKSKIITNIIGALALKSANEKLVFASPPPFSLDPHIEAIAKHFGGAAAEESVEAIIDSLKSDTASEWSQKIAAGMDKCSPTSLKVSFQLQHRGAKITDPVDIFKMEYRVTQKMMETSDFNTGVTALLIDKSKEPVVWNPKTLADVSDDLVDAHFSPASHGIEWDPVDPFPSS